MRTQEHPEPHGWQGLALGGSAYGVADHKHASIRSHYSDFHYHHHNNNNNDDVDDYTYYTELLCSGGHLYARVTAHCSSVVWVAVHRSHTIHARRAATRRKAATIARAATSRATASRH